MSKRKARARPQRGRAISMTARVAAAEGLGLGLLALALLSGLALWSYDAADPAFDFSAPVRNAAGPAGASIAALLLSAVGVGAAIPVLGALAAGLWLLLGGRRLRPPPRFWVGAALLLLSLTALPALVDGMAPGRFAWAGGGALGALLADAQRGLLSGPGALLLNVLALLVGALSLAGVAPGAALHALGRGGLAVGRGTGWLLSAAAGIAGGGLALLRKGAAQARAALGVWRAQRARRRQALLAEREAAARAAAERAAARAAAAPVASAAPAGAAPTGESAPLRPGARRSGAAAPDIVDHARQRSEQPLSQDTFAFRESASSGPYAPPDPEEIFQAAPEGARNYDRESLLMNSRILEKKLADFGVNGRVVTVHPGPVITMYEFEPAPGVKVNRITNLSDDLALALRALSIRIIAPIPGKSVVGIEVPNPEREVVYIRDLLEARGFRNSPSRLTMALGKDIFGNPVEADLAAMPHLLVAGATGTGKSVFLNSLLCSILCRAAPGDVKLLLVDPKLLELSIYDGIPHLIAEVVTNPKRASAALQGIVKKMEERYQMMAALGVRNISQFNNRVDEALAAGERSFQLKARPGEEQGREVEYQRLPYIVVVIDELADLMVVSARDVEESLQRLAQMARAAGIHLVLATQRPSVDVLTGIIKANFPARISFQVSSRTDSRTILDQGGAEHLLGMGDMLFLPPGVSKLQRLHGSFVTEREVSALVAHLRDQGKPEFDEALLRLEEESDAREARPEDTDPHYDMAVQIVAESRNASISYIQRRLKVGYNRAARMIEQMEQEGIVGPQIGTKGREIFVQAVHANGDVG